MATRNASSVIFIVTSSEVEALHLEQNLVKRHRPPFNVRLRDDKSFPYIAVTAEDDYPRVMFTRERHRRGVVYFGPYANAKKVRETLDVLNRVFPYRPCEGPQPGRHSGIPCLDYHIDRCLYRFRFIRDYSGGQVTNFGALGSNQGYADGGMSPCGGAATTGEDMASIAKRVASPKGTTEQGLAVLDSAGAPADFSLSGVDAAVIAGSSASAARARRRSCSL